MGKKAEQLLIAATADVDYATTKLPTEVGLINRMLTQALRTPFVGDAKTVGSVKTAVYAFYDYEHEPIYVGQTRERVSTRVRRHLTGMRSDSVAKFVLDPFEVRFLRVWPLEFVRAAAAQTSSDLATALSDYERAAYQDVLANSRHRAVLNEGNLRGSGPIPQLPRSFEFDIIPDSVFQERSHPDLRLARRAQTIANLARHISERDVSPGLRRALDTQSKRLAALAEERREALNIPSGALAFDIEDEEDQ